MAEPTSTPGAPPVADHRPVPRGVVPRGFQTWLMVGLAAGIVLIILLTGRQEPPANKMPTPTTPAAPNPDRLREYQERLRAMEARQALEAQALPAPASLDPRYEEPAGRQPEDPIAADRKRREYESLFASNVVSSRRPESERPESAGLAAPGAPTTSARREASLDEIAEAVIRATGGTTTSGRGGTVPVAPAQTSAGSTTASADVCAGATGTVPPRPE